MEGIVIKSTGKIYDVLIENEIFIKARLQGKSRILDSIFTNHVVVGDRVSLLKDNHDYFIDKILTRKNFIVRKSVKLSKTHQILASNIDQAILIVTLIKPYTTTKFIDRFLAAAEMQDVEVVLVFNKIDLYDKELMNELDNLVKTYKRIGYQCFKSSFIKDDNKNILSLINNKISLLSGHSGVGKSSLINILNKNHNIKTSNISEYYELGKHTTTFSEMHKVGKNGFVIDTPGIKGFGLMDFDFNTLGYCFKEFADFKKNCRFKSCRCINEPDCGVKKAVELRKISRSRYLSYLSILDEDNIVNRFK